MTFASSASFLQKAASRTNSTRNVVQQTFSPPDDEEVPSSFVEEATEHTSAHIVHDGHARERRRARLDRQLAELQQMMSLSGARDRCMFSVIKKNYLEDYIGRAVHGDAMRRSG